MTLDERIGRLENLSRKAAQDESEESLDAFLEFEELAACTVEELIHEIYRLRAALAFVGHD